MSVTAEVVYVNVQTIFPGSFQESVKSVNGQREIAFISAGHGDMKGEVMAIFTGSKEIITVTKGKGIMMVIVTELSRGA